MTVTDWSNTPEGAIARLDDALSRRGEDVVLRRTFGTQLIPIDVTVRAQMRGYQPNELVGDITQQDQQFILSPTEINQRQWPGAQPQAMGDKRVPIKNDRLLTSRGHLTVQAAAGIYMQDVLVRIEGRARGQ